MTTMAERALGALVAAILITGCGITGGSPSWVNDPTYRPHFDARLVRSQITELRARGNLDPPLPFQVMDYRLAMVQKRVEQGTSPEVALEHSLQNAANEGERDIHFWILPLERLDALNVPPELLRARRLNLAVAVYRQARDHHPRYLVLLATPAHDVRIDI